ncbi:MAG TPA: HU family DNA-binding protein [Paracoccaceae bacterium]|nr:HU family DNA-binding protein [Paracoccaceae bacterium]
MKLSELAETVGEKAGVQSKMAQRVMRSLFDQVLAELESKGEVVLPSFGRFVKRQPAEGKTRIIFIPRKQAPAEAPGAEE